VFDCFRDLVLSRDYKSDIKTILDIVQIESSESRLPQVLKAPLAAPCLGSWVPVHTPSPGVTLKDMEVLGDHCVLTCRESSGELALTAVPLAQPVGAYSIPVSGLAPLVHHWCVVVCYCRG